MRLDASVVLTGRGIKGASVDEVLDQLVFVTQAISIY